MKSITNHLGHILVSIAAIALCISVVVFSSPGITGFFGDMNDTLTEKGDAMLNKVSVPHAQIIRKLETPVVSLSGSVLTITPVANATSYRVYNGNELLVEITDTTVELATYITEYGTYTIKVQPIADGYTSDAATVKYVYELTYVEFTVTSSNRAQVGYTGAENEELVIPATFKDGDTWYKVTTIGQGAFKGCTGLTSVTIPDSVTSIGMNDYSGGGAFEGCTGLTNITIPDSVTIICKGAFKGCTGLTSVTFGENSQLTFIGSAANGMDGAFQLCENLTSIEIPAKVTYLGSNTFRGCDYLRNITFEENSQLTTIGMNAFQACERLTDIVLPEGITSIYNYAFQGCKKLTSFTIPDSVTMIASNAFWGCTRLTSITFENTTGWWYAKFSSDTSGTAVDVTNPTTNATNLTNTYSSYTWNRS